MTPKTKVGIKEERENKRNTIGSATTVPVSYIGSGPEKMSGVHIQLIGDTMPSFKLKFSLGFITSCYVIFSLSMVQAIDIFMIT